MKFTMFMCQDEKNEIVRKTIKRLAKALCNACNQAYDENKCNGCPFKVSHGCNLYNQPITWKSKLEETEG